MISEGKTKVDSFEKIVKMRQIAIKLLTTEILQPLFNNRKAVQVIG